MAYLSRNDIVRYGIALLSVAATLLIERGLSSYLQSTESRLLLLLLPVTLSGWIGGRGPGFVATILAALGAIYVFEPALGFLQVFSTRDLALFFFVAEGILISLLAGMLHQSERRNQAIHRATDGVITANQQGRIVDLSSAAEQLFGYRRKLVLGKHFADLLVPRGTYEGRPDDLWRDIRSNPAGLLGNRIEMTALHADGTTFPVDLSLTLLPQNDGPPYLAGFVRDIRPRKQLEQQLDRQTQITRLLQQANALLSTTRSFENVMQNCLEMVCGITAWPVGRIYLPDELHQELLSSKVVHYEIQGTTTIRDSQRFHRGEGLAGRIWETGEPEWSAWQPEAEGPLAGDSDPSTTGIRGQFGFPVKVHQDVVAVMEFMTTDDAPPTEEVLSLLRSVGEQLGQVIERRRREDQLQKARDAAEAANRAKSEFLANVSHEVRTPMNAVLGVLQIVLGEELPPSIRDHLTTAADSARTLMSLLNDLLDFSRMEAGRFELDAAPFNLRESISASVKTLAFKAQEKDLKLNCSVESDVPDQLIGDVRRLRQVLLNLVGNAIKFTQQGEVAISVSLLRMDEAIPPVPAFSLNKIDSKLPPGSIQLHLTVADTGIGIHPDDQARIFEPFTQVDSSSTRRHTGTGLGLTICTELVRRMGGVMWVESQFGKGSKFHCTIRFTVQPYQKPVVGSKEHTPFNPLSSPTTRTLRVLLAEDTPANQKVVSAILSKRGHQVEIAHDGRETVDKVRNGTFDVILMDVQMPNIDGYQATRMIRGFSEERQARIPIVAMTAHAMSGDREQCLAAGMDDYVPKPIDAMELIHTIERVVEEPSRT